MAQRKWSASSIKKHWKSIIASALLILTAALFVMSLLPVDDLNEINNVPRQSGNPHWVYDEHGQLVFGMSGLVNVTTGRPAYLHLWLNSTYFHNMTALGFWYYNGTHYDPTNPGTKYFEGGWPNYKWWTDDTWLPNTLYENRTSVEFLTIAGWTEAANTTIEYIVILRTQNGTAVSNLKWGGNFTVRYSDSDNLEFQSTYRTYWVTVSACSFFLLADIVFVYVLRRPREEDNLLEAAKRLAEPKGTDEYAKAKHFVQRSDALNSTIESLRTASSILLGLSIAFLYYIGTRMPYLLIGLIALVMACLAGIALSLSDTLVKHEGVEIDDSMLPMQGTVSDTHYGLMLRMGIARRVSVISAIRLCLQLGIIAVAIMFVADNAVEPAVTPLIQTLTNGQFITIWTQVVGWLIVPILGGFAVFFVLLIFKFYGIPFLGHYL